MIIELAILYFCCLGYRMGRRDGYTTLPTNPKPMHNKA